MRQLFFVLAASVPVLSLEIGWCSQLGRSAPIDAEGSKSATRSAPSSKSDLKRDVAKDAWIVSESRPLALRVAIERTTFGKWEPVKLIASLRNDHTEAINVLKPFGDSYSAVCRIDLRGASGKLPYSGPIPSYSVGSGAFERLEPGKVVTETLVLHQSMWKGCDAPGPYSLRYVYEPHHDYYATRSGLPRLWSRKIVSRELKFTRLARELSEEEKQKLTRSDAVGDGTAGWLKPELRPLSMQLRIASNTLEPSAPIKLIAKLRNDGREAVQVLRPFGDRYHAVARSTFLRGPPKPPLWIGFMGTWKEEPPGTKGFVKLGPGEIVSDELFVPTTDFQYIETPGEYTLTFRYDVTDRHGETAANLGIKDLWRGTIVAPAIKLQRKARQAPIKDMELEKDERAGRGGNWVKNRDGWLGMRVRVEKSVVERQEPIKLIVTLRNVANSGRYLRPLADLLHVATNCLKIEGPRGPVEYVGDKRDLLYYKETFVWLEPGESITDTLELHPFEYRGLDQPGKYEIKYSYRVLSRHTYALQSILGELNLRSTEIDGLVIGVERR